MFVRLRIAEIRKGAVSQVLGDIPAKSANHLSDDGSVTRQDLAHFLRIKARGQRCRIYQIAEHDSELSTLGRAGVDDGPSVLSIRLGRENASIGSARSAVS